MTPQVQHWAVATTKLSLFLAWAMGDEDVYCTTILLKYARQPARHLGIVLFILVGDVGAFPAGTRRTVGRAKECQSPDTSAVVAQEVTSIGK